MIFSVNSPLSPSIFPLVVNSPRFSRPPKKFLRITASSAGSDESRTTGKSTLASVLEVPKTLWKRTLQPLGDYGFGRRGVWEGGVGLFMVSGAVLFALAIVWLRGIQLRSRFRKYQVVFEFSQAAGICVGTPVRIRGVTVGSVVRVGSSLKSIDAVAEVCALILLIFYFFVKVHEGLTKFWSFSTTKQSLMLVCIHIKLELLDVSL